MVLDSANAINDNQDLAYFDLAYFLPNAPKVHVVITSRSLTAREMMALKAVVIGEMEPSEAIKLLQWMVKMWEVKPEAREEIKKTMEELGYLALGVILANAYVSMTPRLQLDIRRYLPKYRQWRKELL